METACWICLQEETSTSALVQPCPCPRWVHPQCMARWQLQQAGKPEEKHCRFCSGRLDDWKGTLTPENLREQLDNVAPLMEVFCGGRHHRITVERGPNGLQDFQQKIRKLFKLSDDVDMNFTFGLKDPLTGSQLQLDGCGAFDAAVHCASVAAAAKCAKRQDCEVTRQTATTTKENASNLSRTDASAASSPDSGSAAARPPLSMTLESAASAPGRLENLGSSYCPTGRWPSLQIPGSAARAQSSNQAESSSSRRAPGQPQRRSWWFCGTQ